VVGESEGEIELEGCGCDTGRLAKDMVVGVWGAIDGFEPSLTGSGGKLLGTPVLLRVRWVVSCETVIKEVERAL